jgi:hypothetical protein
MDMPERLGLQSFLQSAFKKYGGFTTPGGKCSLGTLGLPTVFLSRGPLVDLFMPELITNGCFGSNCTNFYTKKFSQTK